MIGVHYTVCGINIHSDYMSRSTGSEIIFPQISRYSKRGPIFMIASCSPHSCRVLEHVLEQQYAWGDEFKLVSVDPYLPLINYAILYILLAIKTANSRWVRLKTECSLVYLWDFSI